jgi:feruloyl esterase
MNRTTLHRGVAALTAAVMTASMQLATNGPALATDDFADAASSKINYTATPVTSSFNCASLTGQSLNMKASVTSATVVPATSTTPAYCDVQGVVKPSILFDVALPIAWNQRLYALGNGGCGGVLASNFANRNIGLANGFAVASTDTGIENTAGNCAWAANRPDLVVDFAYEGIHQTALVAKQLIRTFYSQKPLVSYYNSCSDGGHDGLEEAQKYPADYDGIVAGSPLLGAGTVISNAWETGAFASLPANETMTPAKVAYIASVVYAKCDNLDGLQDGIINDPQTCALVFKPRRDLKVCPAGTNGSACLTPNELRAYEKAIGPALSRGHAIYPGQPLGVEINFIGAQIAAPGAPSTATLDYFLSNTYMQYLFPWPRTQPNRFSDFTFDFNTDPYKIYPFRIMFDPTQLRMDAFFGRGGKLLSYHGLADPLITPYGTIAFYEDEGKIYGPTLGSKYKFYLVPGMGHCAGGPGADQFDPMTKMINWVEGHQEPRTMLSRHFNSTGGIAFTRTLCPYPGVAFYKGGNPNDAASFHCYRGPTGVPDTGPDDGLQLP